MMILEMLKYHALPKEKKENLGRRRGSNSRDQRSIQTVLASNHSTTASESG
jgi:hypothetical protein